MDAIEAAAMAAAEKAFSDAFHDMNVGDGQPLKAAISAYLEVTGVERDALKAGNDNARSAILIWMQTDAQLRDTIASQRAWIEKAGHRPGCASRPVGIQIDGKFQYPGKSCDCGYSELVGGTNT